MLKHYLKKKKRKKRKNDIVSVRTANNEPRLLPPRTKIRIPDIAQEWKQFFQEYHYHHTAVSIWKKDFKKSKARFAFQGAFE